MTANLDPRCSAFRDRLIRIETQRRELAEDIKEIGQEMSKGENKLSKLEIKAIKLGVRRHFESDEKRDERLTVEEMTLALGDFVDLPLGSAAVKAIGPIWQAP